MSSPLNFFLLSLPKAELHLHLEGSVEVATLFELRERHGMPPNHAEISRLYRYADFTGFLMAFKTVAEHLLTPDDYELITYRLMQRLHAQNVVHAEVYVSVGVCLWYKRDFPAIFEGLERGRQRGEREFGISLLWIFDAVRQFGPERAQRVVDMAVSLASPSIVGFGIGGDERRAGPELFREVYASAAEHGLRLTAHAGETAGPESIRGALDLLHAERIGHALTAIEDPGLVRRLAEEQVPVEVSLTSNLLTGCCSTIYDHPVRKYFDAGMLIVLNTDDPAMFSTSLAAEYQLAQRTFGFTNEQMKELARNSFRASFLAEEKKKDFLAKII